jgi:hypothetical protein
MALVKPLFMNGSEGFSEELSLTSGDALNVSNIVIPPSVDGGIGIDLGHNPIINVATPVDPDDGVNKAYVDAVASGLDPHASVKLKTDHKLGSQARRAATGGTWAGAFAIGDKFDVKIDGGTTRTITLSVNCATRAALITEINARWAAFGYSFPIAYTGTASNNIDIYSPTWGLTSEVIISAMGAIFGTEAGMSAGTTSAADFVSGGGTGPTHTLEAPVNGGGYLNVIDGVALVAADVTAGTRILVSKEGGDDATGHEDNGVYTVTTLGTAGAKLKLTRATDADQPTSTEMHKSLYVFVTNGLTMANSGWTEVLVVATMETDPIQFSQFSGAPGYTFDQGLILAGQSIKVDLDALANAQGKGAPSGPGSRQSGLEFDADTSAGKLRVAVHKHGSVQRNQAGGADGGGLEIKLNGSTLANDTTTNPGLGLSVLGVPDLFNIGATPTSQTAGTGQVTAANLNLLTAGGVTPPDASSLHSHAAAPSTSAEKIEKNMGCAGGTVSIGDPVYISAANKVDEADTTDAKSKVIGVARTNPAANIVPVVVAGVCDGVLPSEGETPSPGQAYYLATGGGLTRSLPGAAKRVIQCGMCWNATDLFVRIVDFGKKAA